MNDMRKVEEIIANFNFKKGDYSGAEDQLHEFSLSYEKLSPKEADILRGRFTPKDKLQWLRIASTLFCKFYRIADNAHKAKLYKIFFSLYSFENLDFGLDGLKDLISISEIVGGEGVGLKESWECFKDLTSSDVAINNVEIKLFSGREI